VVAVLSSLLLVPSTAFNCTDAKNCSQCFFHLTLNCGWCGNSNGDGTCYTCPEGKCTTRPLECTAKYWTVGICPEAAKELFLGLGAIIGIIVGVSVGLCCLMGLFGCVIFYCCCMVTAAASAHAMSPADGHTYHIINHGAYNNYNLIPGQGINSEPNEVYYEKEDCKV